jgi:hypothetical protein
MVILLGVSTLIAGLAPRPQEEATSPETTTSVDAPATHSDGRLVHSTLEADARKPQSVRVREGDQLALVVRSRRAGELEIRGLGLIEDVAPLSPARFDILATRPGRFRIHRLRPSQRVGEIVVRRAPASGSGRRA